MLTLVDPPWRYLPNLYSLVLAASYQLLKVLIPPHLSDWPLMSLEDKQCSAILRVPESHKSVLVTRNNFSPFIPPYDKPLLWLALSVPYSFGQLLFAIISYVKNGDVTIDVRGHEVIRGWAALYWWRLVLSCDPVLVHIDTPCQATDANFLVCVYRCYDLWLGRDRVQDNNLPRACSHNQKVSCDVVDHSLKSCVRTKALRIYKLAPSSLIFLIEICDY